ncbi:sugar phosphate isomerase/epimerase family protein [Caproicibacter fermentans]|uniref:TIM barrel protein n=1 Tax=Caproicibacter fermentans TaxID=2576756 RepID=A0A7G8TC68_9FIRM|nr:TIM barrel protein [Caproicibacter fermentans]QNK41209.1 TIM barrel protein [Caproicibacter fermentans]
MAAPKIRREQVAGMNIHYVNYSLDYFLDSQQRCGFKSIELWCAAPHVWLDHMRYYDAKEIARKISRRDLSVHVLTPENCTYPYQFAAKEKEHRERSFQYFSNGIRLANELGCDYMEVNSGWGYWNEDKTEAWQRSADMLHRLAEVAAGEGITLVMEAVRPEESQLVINLESAKKMLDQVGHPNLKAMVDTCAMGVANETLDQWFDALGNDVRHMHFIDGTPYGHLVWGDGNHHLGKFIEALNRRGYQGYLGQEITDGRYFLDPAAADRRNMQNFERYMED